MTTADPENVSILRVALAFAVTFALLGGMILVLRWIKAKGIQLPTLKTGTTRRLQVMETLPIDMRRRLVIVRCDTSEHLLLLGQDRDIVVATDVSQNQTPVLSTSQS